ncbi:caspase recruitment domain-containing protein 19-like isoform X2 [Paramormyrops kingsleyae]|nr:caspase recruitment domain-containing protein 19-like isoform X2 [Paramormyrops kingsleyae]
MDSRLLDKLIQELNQSSPQILTYAEAHKLQNLDVPTCLRMAELLTHLQGKGEEACHQLYRLLHLHAEDMYFSLPTRTAHPGNTEQANKSPQERFVLNNRGPLFFFSCFGLAVGGALLYYYSDGALWDGARAVLAYTALGLSRPTTSLLLLYAEKLGKNR